MQIQSLVPGEKLRGDDINLFKLFPMAEDMATERGRELAIIVAVGRDGAIGRDGDLVRHLPGDLRRFRQLTTGHTVIMGRKTWESLPAKPLPGRRNIVVSRRPDFTPEGAERACSPEEAVRMCSDEKMPFIIGGGELYRQTLPFATRLYLTLVDADTPDADTFFPVIDPSQWASTYVSDDMTGHDGETFRFIDLRRSR